VIQDRRGEWVLLAFRNTDETGAFVGEITDPISVGWSGGGSTAETVVRPSADPLAVVEGETQP
jgi:beta-fructofuranosidase